MSSTGMDTHIEKQLRGPSMVVWLCAATVIVFVIWAFFAWVDEIVRAEGSMISSSRPQIIQNLEGGILAELGVGEGDIVEQGDVLARLHNTQFQSSVDDLQDQISAFEIRRLRLEAEMRRPRGMGAPDPRDDDVRSGIAQCAPVRFRLVYGRRKACADRGAARA